MIRIAIIVAAVFAVLASYGVTYKAGVSSARGECKAAEIQRRLDLMTLDRDRQRAAAAAAEKVGAVDNTEIREAERKNDELAAELERARKDLADAERAASVATEPVNGKCPAPPRFNPRPGGVTSRDLDRLRTFGPD